MRKIYRRSRYNQVDQKKTRVNQHIKALEVQLINEIGEFLGATSTVDALKMAKDKGFDLVEVNPTASPPIAKLVDFGKLKYEQEKRQRKQKVHQKKTEVKGLRLSFRIGQHDLDVRKKQALKHLSQGDKLKIEMNLKGRENRHTDLARKTLTDFIESINVEISVKIDEPIKRLGTKLLTIISNIEKKTKQPID